MRHRPIRSGLLKNGPMKVCIDPLAPRVSRALEPAGPTDSSGVAPGASPGARESATPVATRVNLRTAAAAAGPSSS